MAKELKNKKPYFAIKDSSVKFNVKDVDTVGRTVCFVANTFNFFDSQHDILLPGCADKSILEHGPKSSAPDKIQHALFHDLCRLPGKFKTYDERVIDGMSVLYCESKLSNSTEGNDTLANYLAGIYNQHSIGLQYVDAEWVTKDAHGNSKKWDKVLAECINPEDADSHGQAFVVKEIKLFETSTVAFGANKLTPTLGMKSENKDAVMFDYLSKLDKLTQTIKSGTQSDGMMKIFEVQILQLKQMVSELFEQFTIKSIKDNPDTESKGLDVHSLIKNFSLK